MKAKLFYLCYLWLIICGTLFNSCSKDALKKAATTTPVTAKPTATIPPRAYPAGMGAYITYHMNDGTDITVQKVNNEYILGGDMVLSATQLSAIQRNSSVNKLSVNEVVKPHSTFTANTVLLWPNATVYYAINDPDHLSIINQAISYYNNNTQIHLVPRTSEANYVNFLPAPEKGAGDSNIGMIGGQQLIRLSKDYATLGTVIHELGHTLGLFHEQTRSDRNSYIIVDFSNINSDWTSQYQIYSGISGYEIGPFDFDSIMLYSSFNEEAEVNGNQAPQITTLNGGWIFPQQNELSAGDKAGLTYLYGKLYARLRIVNVPVTPVPDVDKQVKNIFINFYKDAACTIPATLTVNTRVFVTENALTWYTNAPHPVSTFNAYFKIAPAGVSTYQIRSNYTTSLLDDRDDGVNHKSYKINPYIAGGVGYAAVSPSVNQ